MESDTVNRDAYTTRYVYDGLNRVEKIINKHEGVDVYTQYQYDEVGNKVKERRERGDETEYAYDSMNRLQTMTDAKGKTFTYTYDLAGRQITKTDPYGVTQYAYDRTGRILKVEAPGKTTLYGYDKAGNRSSMNETYTSEQSSGYIDRSTEKEVKYILKKSEYVYSDTNRLLQLTEKMYDSTGNELLQKITRYKYDGNGNQQTQTSEYIALHTKDMRESTKIEAYGEDITDAIDELVESVFNEYDGFNRLKKVEGIKSGVRTLTEYRYNGDDLRVAKIVSQSDNNYTPVETRYLYDRQHVVLETDEAGALKTRYIRGVNYIARMDSTNKHAYFLYNGHGDVVQTVTETGEVENQYDYDIWGNATLTVQQYDCAIRYAGEYYDSETGLYYLRARYYDPYTGRFISEDSYWGEDANPLSLNRYTYCENDPVLCFLRGTNENIVNSNKSV